MNTSLPDKFINLLEPITYENIKELSPGEWIWDNKQIEKEPHRRVLSSDSTVFEAAGFRQIHILDLDCLRFSSKPFMLSLAANEVRYRQLGCAWEYFEEGRFYRFKNLRGHLQLKTNDIDKFTEISNRLCLSDADTMHFLIRFYLEVTELWANR